jgi:hypothetical protein
MNDCTIFLTLISIFRDGLGKSLPFHMVAKKNSILVLIAALLGFTKSESRSAFVKRGSGYSLLITQS